MAPNGAPDKEGLESAGQFRSFGARGNSISIRKLDPHAQCVPPRPTTPPARAAPTSPCELLRQLRLLPAVWESLGRARAPGGRGCSGVPWTHEPDGPHAAPPAPVPAPPSPGSPRTGRPVASAAAR